MQSRRFDEQQSCTGSVMASLLDCRARGRLFDVEFNSQSGSGYTRLAGLLPETETEQGPHRRSFCYSIVLFLSNSQFRRATYPVRSRLTIVYLRDHQQYTVAVLPREDKIDKSRPNRTGEARPDKRYLVFVRAS